MARADLYPSTGFCVDDAVALNLSLAKSVMISEVSVALSLLHMVDQSKIPSALPLCEK